MILVNIRRIINDYTECNLFEIKITDKKVKFYYHDKIEHFSSDKIIVSKDNKKYLVEGKNMVIETMFEEMIAISGVIKRITMVDNDE